MGSNDYVVIFDTNVLYTGHTNFADFTKFSFNSNFNNIIEKIESLDIYSEVSISIPFVTWEEMKKQKIDAYNEKLNELNKIREKCAFPNLHIESKIDDFVYGNYIEEKIEEYEKRLQ